MAVEDTVKRILELPRAAMSLIWESNRGVIHQEARKAYQSICVADVQQIVREREELLELMGQMNRDISLPDGRIYAMPQGWLLADGRGFDSALEAYRALKREASPDAQPERLATEVDVSTAPEFPKTEVKSDD